MDRALSRINGPDQDAIAFGREYVSSEAFRSLFRDGMNLIEEASVYLDGEGRQEARHLPRLEALSYANESMRLTTRLMQLASWLLLHRSLADGEISAEELNRQRAKIRMVPSDVSGAEETRDQMPVKMRELIQLSLGSSLASCISTLSWINNRKNVLSGTQCCCLTTDASIVSLRKHKKLIKKPRQSRGLILSKIESAAYFLEPTPKPSKRLLKRDTRPPRSIICC